MPDPLRQEQFLDAIDRDEAERRFRAVLDLSPLPAETVPLASAAGRVLAADVAAPIDVPGFDRSNVDGFAVRAADTFGAAEDTPLTLTLTSDTTVTPLFAARPSFGDVAPRDRAAEAIAQLATLGIIRGYSNGDFGPNNHTQRSQMALPSSVAAPSVASPSPRPPGTSKARTR